MKIKYIGIDIGSSYSHIVFGTKDGQLLAPGNLIDPKGIPTVYSNTESKPLSAVGALDAVFSLKEDLLDRANKKDTDSITEYLRTLLHMHLQPPLYGSRQYFIDNSDVKICVGFPAIVEEAKTRRYKEAIKKALINVLKDERVVITDRNIRFEPEPALVASAYAFFNKPTNDENILVVDCGGYTVDLVLMNVTAKGALTLKTCLNNGARSLATALIGKYITREFGVKILCRDVFDSSIDRAKEELFARDDYLDYVTEERTAKYTKRDGSEAKFRLSFFCKGTERDGVPVYSFMKNDKEGDGQSLDFGHYIRHCKELVQLYLDSVISKDSNIEETKVIDRIVFTGGSSKITPIREAILDAVTPYCRSEEAECEMLSEPDSQLTQERPNLSNAVALGACIVASGLANIETNRSKISSGYSEKDKEVNKLRKELEKLKEENGNLKFRIEEWEDFVSKNMKR